MGSVSTAVRHHEDHPPPRPPGHHGLGGPTIYKIDQEEGTAERVMTAVSSTVIPLEDLPELQVGYGFGLVDKENVPNPDFLKDVKLITSANKHRFIVPGGVKQLTKEEFEAFTNQV